MSSEIERRVAKLEAHLAQASPESPTAVYVEVLEGLTGLSRDEILRRAPDDAALFNAILNELAGPKPLSGERLTEPKEVGTNGRFKK